MQLAPSPYLVPPVEHVLVNDYEDIPVPCYGFECMQYPIHPLWRREAFDLAEKDEIRFPADLRIGCPMLIYVYERLEPALALASILLDRARHFMEPIMFAPLIESSRWNPYPYPALEDWEPNEDDSRRYDDQIRDLCKTFQVYRSSAHSDGKDQRWQFGSTSRIANESGQEDVIFTAISGETIDLISADDWDLLAIEEQQVVSLLLAITLVHELAHAVDFKRRDTFKRTMGHERMLLPEHVESAFYPHESLQELGWRLEYELFGGELRNGRCSDFGKEGDMIMDGSEELMFSPYNFKKEELESSYVMPDEAVNALFALSTWINAAGQLRPLKLYLLPVETEPSLKIRITKAKEFFRKVKNFFQR